MHCIDFVKKLLPYLLLSALAASGCAAVNPYESDFQCPSLKNGKCQGVSESYQEAVEREDGSADRTGGKPGAKSADSETTGKTAQDSKSNAEVGGVAEVGGLAGRARSDDETEASTISAPETEIASAEETFRQAVYEKLGKLVKEPKAPLMNPPGSLRVWILPYEGEDGSLFMDRFVFLKIAEPAWTLGQPLPFLPSSPSSDD